VVVVTPNAELEPGFVHWFSKITNIAKEAGLAIEFFASKETNREMRIQQNVQKSEGKLLFTEFSRWMIF
jgi:hypothetical protein